jgi:ketosteroid isomerase-like protein
MDDINTLVAEHACAKLIMACYSWMDLGDYPAVAELFSDEATWVRGGTPVKGKSAILAALQKRSPADVTRHLITNVVVSVRDGDTADATACFMPLRGARAAVGPAPMPKFDTVGDVTFKFRREDGAWKITNLQPTPVFKG